MSSPMGWGGVKRGPPCGLWCERNAWVDGAGLAAPWHGQGRTVTYQLPLLCWKWHHGRRDFSREQLLACLEEDLGNAGGWSLKKHFRICQYIWFLFPEALVPLGTSSIDPRSPGARGWPCLSQETAATLKPLSRQPWPQGSSHHPWRPLPTLVHVHLPGPGCWRDHCVLDLVLGASFSYLFSSNLVR